MKGTAYVIWIWGTKEKIILDALVLGRSLRETKPRARMIACVNEDTINANLHVLLKAYWEILPVTHLILPDRIVSRGITRLQGVYSKLQVWKYLAHPGDWHCIRVVMLDVDMLVRGNIDSIFMQEPVAAVLRGCRDNAILERRELFLG